MLRNGPILDIILLKNSLRLENKFISSDNSIHSFNLFPSFPFHTGYHIYGPWLWSVVITFHRLSAPSVHVESSSHSNLTHWIYSILFISFIKIRSNIFNEIYRDRMIIAFDAHGLKSLDFGDQWNLHIGREHIACWYLIRRIESQDCRSHDHNDQIYNIMHFYI